MSESAPQFEFDGWAVIEFMGHVKRAGKVRTSAIGGSAVFIVETPSDGDFVTEIYSTSALYRFTPTTEEVARMAAKSVNPAPISPYDLPADWRVAINQAARQKLERARAIEASTVTVQLSPAAAALVVGAIASADSDPEGKASLLESQEIFEAAISANNGALRHMAPPSYDNDDEDYEHAYL